MIQETIVTSWFNGYNQRDWESMKSIYSDDAVIHAKSGDLVGGNSVVELAKKWLGAFPDVQVDPLCTALENDVVVVHWRAEGTFTNPVLGIAASGKKVVFHGLTCFRVNQDKVVEHWASVDYRPLFLSKEGN